MRALVGLGLAALAVAPSRAEVIRFEVLSVERPALQGRVFGERGAAERIAARATIAVDPDAPRNAVIADLGLAPRNGEGRVEAVADVMILRPERPNGLLVVDVPNRGRKVIGSLLDDASAAGAGRLEEAGDAGRGFLLGQGYTLAWIGWQGDLAPGSGLRAEVPTLNGLTGQSREEWSFDHMRSPIEARLSYPAADLDPGRARLTVRARADDARVQPGDLGFRFLDPERIEIIRPAQGYDGSALYELTYTARDPKVMGLGLLALRDVASFLRHERGPSNPLVAEGRPGVDRAIAFGLSQSGRVLRDMLHLGLNEDDAGRVVFDGMVPYIAGSRRSFTNARFAQPSRNPGPHTDRFYPADQFPFTYGVTTDVLTGRRDGLFLRCRLSNTCPRVFHVDHEYELWGSRGSLVVTDTRGHHLDLPPDVRAYMVTGTPHLAPADATTQTVPSCELPINPLSAGAPARALLLALDAWIAQGIEPPASRYPNRASGTLGTPQGLYPPIPGLPYRGLFNPAHWVEPGDPVPAVRGSYPVLLPRVDTDGNTLGGIRLPVIEAPRATYTAWNPMRGLAAASLCAQQGGVLAFAATRAERAAAGDPRLSLEERYSDARAYTAAVRLTAERLVQERLLTKEDAEVMINLADEGGLVR